MSTIKTLTFAVLGAIILSITLYAAQAQSLSILSGPTPDIVLGRQFISTADCVEDVCTFKNQKAIEAGSPLWSSGSHTLMLYPILTLKDMAWDIDHTPKVEVGIDGKRFLLKDGETKDLTPYSTVKINMQAMTQQYIQYGQSAFINPPANYVYKDRLYGIKYEINIFLNPDTTSTLLLADSVQKQFKRDSTVKFQLISNNGLDWVLISGDSSNAFFTGTKYSVIHAPNVQVPTIIEAPLNTDELGDRKISAFPAIQSGIYDQDGIKTQDSIYTQSSNGVQATISVLPEVIGTKEIPTNAFPVSRIQQLKKTSTGDQEIIQAQQGQKTEGSLLGIFLIAGLAYAIWKTLW